MRGRRAWSRRSAGTRSTQLHWRRTAASDSTGLLPRRELLGVTAAQRSRTFNLPVVAEPVGRIVGEQVRKIVEVIGLARASPVPACPTHRLPGMRASRDRGCPGGRQRFPGGQIMATPPVSRGSNRCRRDRELDHLHVDQPPVIRCGPDCVMAVEDHAVGCHLDRA